MSKKSKTSNKRRTCRSCWCCCNIFAVWSSMLGLRATSYPTKSPVTETSEIADLGNLSEESYTSEVHQLEPSHSNSENSESQNITDKLVISKNRSVMASEVAGQYNNRITSATSESKSSRSEARAVFTAEQQITVLRETVVITRKKLIAEIDHVDEHYIDGISIDRFLEYIERERLTHMPHRGSKWDLVLKWAEFFALQISGYAKVVSPFVPDSKEAAKLIWASCRTLLELGPENAAALETTFAVFYKLGLSLSFFLRHHGLLHVTHHIRMEVGKAFNDLLKLVHDVSIYYQVKTFTTTSSVEISFSSLFGNTIDMFHNRKDHIIDAMWEYRLGGHVTDEIRSLRKWLSPRDPVVNSIVNHGRALTEKREEFTCEWFQRSLLDFTRSKDDNFEVIGPSGSGKSVLFGWILERLQRPLGKKTHQTLSFKFPADIAAETTGLAAVKSLALQLLENNVGDANLYNALIKAKESANVSKTTYSLEESLWRALQTGLSSDIAKTEHYMIVIDGLDKVKDGAHGASHVQGHLATLTSQCSNVQSLTLSTESPSSVKSKTRILKITPDLTHEDLRRVTERAFGDYVHFKEQNEFEEESIVEVLLHAAKGNFTWSLLTVDYLKQETSQNEFMKAVKKAKESPRTVSDMVQQVVNSLDFTKRDTRLILSWLSVVERPLTLTEIKCLLQVGLQTKLFHDRKSDIVKDVKAACGSLVVVENEFVRFRFSAIRTQLLKMQAEGKKVMTRAAAQADLTSRLVAYCKFSIHEATELLVDFSSVESHRGLFGKHALLDYAVRYWTVHFRSSSMKTEKAYQFTSEFKALFPGSAQFAILEWICWDSDTWYSECIDAHTLALHVRETMFTEKHQAVLQNLVICGNLHRKLSNVTEAGNVFYRACTLGQLVLKKYHSFITTCSTLFLTITETTTSTTRTEIITRKEEILKYVIVAHTHQHGKTSDIVIRYHKILAELYMEIHEEEKAETIWRELREIVIIRHGKGSEEERSISGQITVILKKHGKQEDIIEYEKNIFETASIMEAWDERRIKIMLELAISYETRGEFFMAEELYVTIWRRLIERCGDHHHHGGVEIHILTIDVVLEYVRFLRRRHRHEEACNILICIWTSYEVYEFESETLFLRLKIIGELMRAVGLLTVAISVFKKCLAWFSFRGHHEHVKVCEVLISEVSVEIVKTTTTTTTREITTTTTTSETVIRESFELSLTQTVTVETISIFKSMISYYMKLEQWSEALECSRKSLSVIWRMILSGTTTVCALPEKFSAEAIEIAIHLAVCHLHSHHFWEAEEIYIKLYRACLNSCHIHDERVTRGYTVLIAFYEEHHHWHKMIEVYQELLIEYRKHLGASHKKTIEVLYILGSLCEEHGHGRALEYYEEIIEVLNAGVAVCHHDAFKALKIVCRIYYEGGHWHKLKVTCEKLWHMFTHHHHEYTFDAAFVEIIYARYRYVLEHHFHCEYEFLRTITITYRDLCIKIFGAAVAITIKALIEFAHICMRSEKYIFEAVETYEKVLTITTTTTTTTTTTREVVVTTEQITKIKQTLVQAYTTICSYESTTTTTVERAIKIVLEHFEFIKVKFGCAHVETLLSCRRLMLLYMKLKTQEAYSHIKRILVEVAYEIIAKEKHSRALNEAARTLGEIFLACDLAEYGLKMIQEMRHQVITGKSTPKCGFAQNFQKSVGKVSYVFLVTFQETLEKTVVSRYAEIMSEILTETFLYEHYTYCVKSNKKIEEILIHTARLRAFLVKHDRHDQAAHFEDEVYQKFLGKWNGVIKVRREITHVFYIGLLEELAVEGVTIGYAACVFSTSRVKKLLEQGKHGEAFDLATCAFQFLNHMKFYHDIAHVGFGFKLSSLMALRGIKTSDKGVDAKVRAQMLDLSRTIIREVIKACKESKINFVRLQLGELNDLVGLLGDQENYTDLEWLLTMLWSSRDVHKSWSSQTIVAIGRRLVEVKFIQNHKSEAIRLCEDISYNLRSLWSSLHPHTLEMSDLLCQLYTSAGHYREAMGVHETILRLVIEGDDDDDSTIDTVSSQVAKKHVDLLKQSYLRLGGWDKSSATYKELIDAVLDMEAYKGRPEWQGVHSPNKWNVKETPDESDKFKTPLHWEFDHVHDESEEKEASPSRKKRPGLAAKRASSNWGMGLIHRFLHGEKDSDDEEEEEEEQIIKVREPGLRLNPVY